MLPRQMVVPAGVEPTHGGNLPLIRGISSRCYHYITGPSGAERMTESRSTEYIILLISTGFLQTPPKLVAPAGFEPACRYMALRSKRSMSASSITGPKWCQRRASNPHALASRRILRPSCFPITSRWHGRLGGPRTRSRQILSLAGLSNCLTSRNGSRCES
jgi:hypothetical protein